MKHQPFQLVKTNKYPLVEFHFGGKGLKASRTLSCILVAIFLLGTFTMNVVSEKELAPDFTVDDVDGGTFTLSDNRGKVVFIDFLYTDCAHCVSIQEELKKLRGNFTEQELVMISISTDDRDSVADVSDFKYTYGGNWQYAKGGLNIEMAYEIHYTPTEYIIDVNGYVYSSLVGYREWGELADDIEAAKTGYVPPTNPPPNKRDLAPDFTLVDVDGNIFTLSDYQGRVVIIDFFAISCPQCYQMQQELEDVRQVYSDEEVVIISISLIDTNEEIRQHRSLHGGDWVYARDDQALNASYGVYRLPTECVIDVNGYIQSCTADIVASEELVIDIEDAKTGYEPPPDDSEHGINWFFILTIIAVFMVLAVILIWWGLRKKQ